MKKGINIVIILFFLSVNSLLKAQTPTLTVDLSEKGAAISSVHNGIFFEDINHAADGGLYAELIRNRSFEDDSSLTDWTLFNDSSLRVTSSIETENLLNSAQNQALKLSFVTDGTSNARAGVYNSGYWGINVVNGQTYKLSFYAKCDSNYTGNVVVSLANSASTYAIDTIGALSTDWKQYTLSLTADGTTVDGRLCLSFNSNGVVWLDVVSLFPPTFRDRENGMRPDLAQMLADIHPKFMRFPGGCFVEGDVLANRFQWTKSIGKIEERPGHYNLWGYRTSDGMGYHEMLQFCEDIGAEPLFVVNVGLAHDDYQNYTDLSEYIQDALDAIEYANGDTTTTYGALRATNGHPNSFDLKYIEVGNENYYGNNYGNRYIQFYNAIKEKYPDIQIIGNVAAWGTDTPAWTFDYSADLIDEHYYRTPQWFIGEYNKYDSYARTDPKVYVGEYAVTSGCGNGNLIAALGEAVYMAGIEKNSDIVPMNSYAPIFVNTNDRYWSPDMIVFDNSTAYGTPSYYVQKLFSTNIGTVNVQMAEANDSSFLPIVGNVGVGSWKTSVQYSDVHVTNDVNDTLFSDNFSDAENWSAKSGTWSVSSNIYSQTSTNTDCRSVSEYIAVTTYTYSLKAKKISGSEGFLIIFGYQDSNNFYWWNIGGWNNTKHAIEKCTNGSKTTVASVAGSISSNVWYDIRMEISKQKVACYLNNVLIHTLENTESKLLYTAATLDEANDLLYLKVINPSCMKVASRLNVDGLNSNDALLDGTVATLTSDSALAENSFEQPTRIVPVNTDLATVGNSFEYTFQPYSFSIFKLNVGNINAIENRNEQKTELEIYPNPCEDFLCVKNGENCTDCIVEIYDLTGKMILKKPIGVSKKINISHLNSGIYLVKITNDGEEYSEKLIKK